MTPASRSILKSFIRSHEGGIGWLYLDTDDPPNVTVANGHEVPSPEAASRLTMNKGPVPATPDAIVADWWEVVNEKNPDGKYAAGYYQQFCQCRMSDAAQDALLDADLDEVEGLLLVRFPKLLTWPETAQMAISDMGFEMGPAEIIIAWPKFCAAADLEDFPRMAAECTMAGNGPNLARQNAQNRAWLLGQQGLLPA